ncbi:MAG: septal ring lytic transglycosylase RlpA family protein, partial [Stellaceae bacterium]
ICIRRRRRYPVPGPTHETRMSNRRGVIAVFAGAAFLAACHSLPVPSTPIPSAPTESSTENGRPAFTQVGLASWYGPHFDGKRTADGERFDRNALTAAHRTLPLNSYVRVTNLANNRSVIVRINDRGPYVGNRIIDLSARAARDLGIRSGGVARVRIELVTVSEAGGAAGR